MAVTRAERREERRARVEREFPRRSVEHVLDFLELVELAWHDCYGESTPPDRVIDDIFVAAGGDLSTLLAAGRLAVKDYRDLRVWADGERGR